MYGSLRFMKTFVLFTFVVLVAGFSYDDNLLPIVVFAQTDTVQNTADGKDNDNNNQNHFTPISFYPVHAGLKVAHTSLDDAQDTLHHAEYAIEFALEQFILGLESFRNIDHSTADEIHLELFDIKTTIHDVSVEQSRNAISTVLDKLQQFDKTQTTKDKNTAIVYILTVADEQYLYADNNNAQENHTGYEISRILFIQASDMFSQDANLSVMRDLEIQSFFTELIIAVNEKDNFVTVGTLVSAIQRDLLGLDITSVRDHMVYFDNIDKLYEEMRMSLNNGDYQTAQEYAIEAYLENFEYLEPILEEIDAEFMYGLEIDMREELRDMIRQKRSSDMIIEFLDQTILPKLDYGESLVVKHLSAQAAASAISQSNMALEDINDKNNLKAMGDTTESEQSAVRSEIDFIRDSLQETILYYESGEYDSAYTTARTAYLDSYEYVEIPLRSIAPDFTLEVEYLFAELRNAIKHKAPIQEIRSLVTQIDRNLDESERLVTGTGQVAPMIAFTASFAIIFREGLEAVLILGAIMTYLEASRNNRFKPFVHYGVIAAIGATAVTWFVASYIIEISGASRELIEAIAALSATAVLFYVSFWILNKIEHKKWMEFVKAKVWQATTTGSVMVFVMLSFFTVYREGFETVLFYQAMFGFAKYMEMYVGLGFIIGLGSLFAIYYIMRLMGKRLPLRVLFGLTMGIGAYLSIAFLGNAIRELQILDYIPYTNMIGVIPRLDINMATMTGIYPTLETVIGQIVLLSVYVVASIYILIIRPKKERMIAAMRQSRRTKSNDV